MIEYPTYAELRKRFRKAGLVEQRSMIEIGAAFASFSIMTPTEDAERLLRKWIDRHLPLTLDGLSEQLRGTREKRLLAVRNLNSLQITMLAGMQSPGVERAFADWTWGYGPAKASFAMACSGIGYLPCIDRRILRKHEIPEREIDNWEGYLMWSERLYPGIEDKASAGAFEWTADLSRERFDTQHRLLLGEPAPQLEMPL